MVWIPEGVYVRGDDAGNANERPAHRVREGGFWIETTEVSVRRFRAFVEATGHVTDAELAPEAGRLSPEASALISELHGGTLPEEPGALVFSGAGGVLFRWQAGATWMSPDGPDGEDARDEDPVRQVSLRDAQAFAAWAGLRLPTESEWERAARGPESGQRFAWGDTDHVRSRPLANVWSGVSWQDIDRARDGYRRVSAARSFPPNGWGLFDVAGNVWEIVDERWSADRYTQDAAAGLVTTPSQRFADGPGGGLCVLKGGGYLSREGIEIPAYRPAAREPWPVDLARCDAGFRCVLDPQMRWSGEGRP